MTHCGHNVIKPTYQEDKTKQTKKKCKSNRF